MSHSAAAETLLLYFALPLWLLAGFADYLCHRASRIEVTSGFAIGVDRETPSLSGDKALMELDLDWIILRPSVVIGRPAYGASALMRGLAALPALPVMPNTGQLQIVRLEDVVRTVEHFLHPGAHAEDCRTGRPGSLFFP